MTDYRALAVLTEHFGYPPLALIDDVINAVNDIMYKCTQAMETYLRERKLWESKEIKDGEGMEEEKDIDMDGDTLEKVRIEEEIQIGTGKLETLLESQVDKNFDKFELYALRNIFTLPNELLEEGWIRLKHHDGLNFRSNKESDDFDGKIREVIRKIGLELKLRKVLKLRSVKANKIVRILQQYAQCVRFLHNNSNNEDLSDEAKNALNSLIPLDENVYFIVSQVNELTLQVQNLNEKLTHTIEDGGVENITFAPTPRDDYIEEKSYRLLETVGALDSGGTSDRPQEKASLLIDAVSVQILEDAKHIGQELRTMYESSTSDVSTANNDSS